MLMKGITIIHMIIVFSVLAWSAGQPFMGELFAYKSQMLLYQTVMGNGDLVKKLQPAKENELKDKLNRNAKRFSQLPEEQKNEIQARYDHLQQQVNRPWQEKLRSSWHILAYELPVFEQLWILLSIVVVLLLIFHIEGAKQIAWLLPVVVLCYAVDNYLSGANPKESADTALFPSEKTITSQYLYEPLSSSILEQQQQLQQGWQLYLIREWANEIPSKDQDTFQQQAEKGEFQFTLARIDKLSQEESIDRSALFHEKKSLIVLLLYFLWNLFFAWMVNKFYSQST